MDLGWKTPTKFCVSNQRLESQRYQALIMSFKRLNKINKNLSVKKLSKFEDLCLAGKWRQIRPMRIDRCWQWTKTDLFQLSGQVKETVKSCFLFNLVFLQLWRGQPRHRLIQLHLKRGCVLTVSWSVPQLGRGRSTQCWLDEEKHHNGFID